MESTGYVLGTNDVITSQVDSSTTKIKKRFPFNSTLKRMSVLVDSSSSKLGLCVFSKGAPEIISKMLTHVPIDYEITYKYHMNKGKRVLALAYRVLGNASSSSNKDSLQMKRDEIEKNLQFAGFLIFDCEMKPDSKSVMKELVASDHKVIMITGDSPFTACEVARKLGMLRSSLKDDRNSPVLNLSIDAHISSGKEDTFKQLNWTPIDSVSSSSEMTPFSLLDSSLKSLSSNFKLCVSGSALSHLKSLDSSENSYFNILKQISPYISVFARVSPIQKEDIILALNNSGLTTLMVGDGTNDVGALKAAHVGVSIVNDPEFESRIDNIKNSKQKKNSNGSLNAKDRMVIGLFFFK